MLHARSLLYVIVALSWATTSDASEHYPRIEPIQRTISVPDVKAADVSMMIKSTDGQPVYAIQCHSSDYSGDPNFDYSGDFECRMIPIGSSTSYSTLFTEDPDQSRDWESRARFFAADLQGDCAGIPQFGATRDFKLRGMEVTLQIVKPMFNPGGKLQSLTLRVFARPSPSALLPIAEAVTLPAFSEPQCKIAQYFSSPVK